MEFVLLILGVYFAPALVALVRGHHNRSAIFVLNLVLGWSLIGWAYALVWAFTVVRNFGPSVTDRQLGSTASSGRAVRPQPHTPSRSGRRLLPLLGGLSCLLVFPAIVVAVLSADPKRDTSTQMRSTSVANVVTGSLAPPGPMIEPRKAALLNTRLNAYRWRTDGFGTVMVLSGISIENGGAASIKDIRITCELFAPSGTTLNVLSGTIYERVAPGKSRTFRELNMGFINAQAASASCRVVAVEL